MSWYQTTPRQYVLFYDSMTRELMDRKFDPMFVRGSYESLVRFNKELKKPIDTGNLEKLVIEYEENSRKYKT